MKHLHQRDSKGAFAGQGWPSISHVIGHARAHQELHFEAQLWQQNEQDSSGQATALWGVSITGGTPKWMVHEGESWKILLNFKINDLGIPLFQETSISI